MDETKEITIDLKKIFFMMKSKLIYVLLATILLGAVAGCYTHFFISPVYSSTVQMYVYSNPDRVSTETAISINDLNASTELRGTYMSILESDSVLEKVVEDLQLNATPDDLNKMVTPSLIEGTQLFKVTVKSTDPYLAAKIANSIAKVAPDEIVRIVKAGGVEIVDKAKVPKKPSSPNMKKNIVIGAFLGFIISFIILLIYEIFDTTITTAKDLEREFEIPILGTIPRLVPSEETDDSNISRPFSNFSKAGNKLQSALKSTKGDAKND